MVETSIFLDPAGWWRHPSYQGQKLYLQYQAGESRWGSPPPALMQLEGECSNTPDCSPIPGGQRIQAAEKMGMSAAQPGSPQDSSHVASPYKACIWSSVHTGSCSLERPHHGQCPCRLRSGSRAEGACLSHYQDEQGSMLCPSPIQTNVCPHTPGSHWTGKGISSHASHLALL